ncbi:uncharacterized protein B0H18DRAFT_566543 [Fomitopsis serialis]|uniref:uncharacterized protein n=1 Tax=Fomitopsis serialis TaxID=139415 RepID=UPI002007482E|nr:uncharacterized protein B0H18DRAFT_566543 [Neoantrodia serialis]KAH9921324.1 hypothetical protein B0H18DRAFT_566543 [Neoantrodia serialis]
MESSVAMLRYLVNLQILALASSLQMTTSAAGSVGFGAGAAIGSEMPSPFALPLAHCGFGGHPRISVSLDLLSMTACIHTIENGMSGLQALERAQVCTCWRDSGELLLLGITTTSAERESSSHLVL